MTRDTREESCDDGSSAPESTEVKMDQYSWLPKFDTDKMVAICPELGPSDGMCGSSDGADRGTYVATWKKTETSPEQVAIIYTKFMETGMCVFCDTKDHLYETSTAHHCDGSVEQSIECRVCRLYSASVEAMGVFEGIGHAPENSLELWDDIWIADDDDPRDDIWTTE